MSPVTNDGQTAVGTRSLSLSCPIQLTPSLLPSLLMLIWYNSKRDYLVGGADHCAERDRRRQPLMGMYLLASQL